MAINPFQPSTAPWDQSFTGGAGERGSIIFPSAVPPNASPLVPIVQQSAFNIGGLSSPPAIQSYWDATVIQLTMDGANGGTTFVDQKFGSTPTTSASCTTSISEYVFGGASMLVDNSTSSYRGLQFADQTYFALGKNDFTIEGWVLNTGGARQYACMASHGNNTSADGNWILYMNHATSTDGLVYFVTYPGPVTLAGTSKVNNGVWHHIAVTRIGTVWSLYIDGVREATATSGITLADRSEALCFGGGYGFTVSINGYMDMWRIVNGVSVYTGTNFLVPTAPFPTA